VKSGQHSPSKHQSPSLLPKKIGAAYGTDGASASAEHYPVTRRQAHDSSDEIPIPIDPSALQKEDLAIAPHNFLELSSSPPYDKLSEEKGEENISVLPASKGLSTQSATQYKLETALQEVMASENLPPPPTHLLEISGQLDDIDYDELNAPSAVLEAAVLPSRTEHQPSQDEKEKKKEINPEMLARSLDTQRNSTSNPMSYPPHIAKFMSRVRNSSTDADDPTQQTRHPVSKQTGPENAPFMGEASTNNVFAGVSHHQRPASTKADTTRTSDHQYYNVPKAALGRAFSLENANKQSSHPVPMSGARQRSSTLQAGRSQAQATSYTLPRGRYTSSGMQEFSGGPRSRETTPSSVHSHSHSDVIAEADYNREGQLQSTSTHSMQYPSAGYTRNGAFRPNPRPPSVPIHGKRPAQGGGDSIPNSPTYFTQYHPHRDKTTPSPEAQFANQSFREHLTSLQPVKGAKRTNVASWMQQSSNYWNSNKSAPFLKDSRTSFPPNPPIRSHFHQNPRPSLPNPTITPAGVPVFGSKPVPQATLGHQQAAQGISCIQPTAAALLRPTFNVPPNHLASSSSSTSLHRSPQAALGPSQSHRRPHSARPATIGDNYFVLDV
jgi:hypothetical protein